MPAGPDAWFAEAKAQMASAKTLKHAGHARQAYHNAGQAVEYVLKAIHMRRRGLNEWPADLKGAAWHDLQRIAGEAGLGPDLAELSKSDKPCFGNWLTARDWDSNGRFPGNTPPTRELNDLFLAVCHEQTGIMGWLESIFHKS
jgi:HEPN domain-containing protein